MKTIVNDNQRGFLFKNGRFSKLLGPGRYRTFGDSFIELSPVEYELQSDFCTLETLLSDRDIAASVTEIEVVDQTLALHFVNGRFSGILKSGRYAFWSMFDHHTFVTTDITSPKVSPDIPEYIFASIDPELYTKVEISAYEKGRLYLNRQLTELLEPGTYYYWNTGVLVEYDVVDTRLCEQDIIGQEILTADKVSVRINLVVFYRVTDYVKCFTEICDFESQLHVAAQLALRDYVGKYRIDEILDNKDALSRYVLDRIKAKAPELYIEVDDGGIKDIILPGEIRDIMNTVLIATKQAEANVITRREEVASTRSLLNTARLMDENKTLFRLKELEYIERICQNVSSLNIGNGDVLQQLTKLISDGGINQ